MTRITVDNQTFIETIEHDHFEEFFKVVETNRSYLLPWISWLELTNSTEEKKRLFEIFINRCITFGIQTFVILYKNQLVGSIGFNEINWETKHATFGYWISEHVRGQGIVKRCASTIIELAFHTLGLESLEIRCSVENIASQRIPEKLGFEFVKITKQAEKFLHRSVDLKIYILHKTEHHTK